MCLAPVCFNVPRWDRAIPCVRLCDLDVPRYGPFDNMRNCVFWMCLGMECMRLCILDVPRYGARVINLEYIGEGTIDTTLMLVGKVSHLDVAF